MPNKKKADKAFFFPLNIRLNLEKIKDHGKYFLQPADRRNLSVFG